MLVPYAYLFPDLFWIKGELSQEQIYNILKVEIEMNSWIFPFIHFIKSCPEILYKYNAMYYYKFVTKGAKKIFKYHEELLLKHANKNIIKVLNKQDVKYQPNGAV